MEFNPELWYLFPASIAIATIAMASGVGGAIFFSPLFILVLGLEPKVAIGTALFTELFGFSSGLFAYSRNKLIDYKLGISILRWSIPFAILGVLLSSYFPADILKGAFALGIIVVGIQIFIAARKEKNEPKDETQFDEQEHESTLVDADGKAYHYTICNKRELKAVAITGGTTTGLISVGLGELMDFQLITRCKVPPPVAVGTAVFCVVVTVLIASIGHFYEFVFHSESGTVGKALSVAMFTVPGVLIGGQIGPRIQKLLPEDKLKLGLAILFVFIGLLMGYALFAR